MIRVKIKPSDWTEIDLNNKDTFPKENVYYYLRSDDWALFIPPCPEKGEKHYLWRFLGNGPHYVRDGDQYVEIEFEWEDD
jgi:hypothetical protein